MIDLINEIKNRLAKNFGDIVGVPIDPTLFTETEPEHGDLALPCFALAKQLGKSPQAIATDLVAVLSTQQQQDIDKVEAVGPYLNLFLNRKAVVMAMHKANSVQPKNTSKKKHVLLEYISPGTNKPLHLGHLRNAALGWSAAKILEATNHQVTTTQIVNNRGIHIMHSVLGYDKWGDNETPESSKLKGDHLIAKYYVRFTQEAAKDEALKEEAQEYLRKWEANDAHVQKTWRQLNAWTLAGHAATEERFGVTTDHTYYESDIYKRGRELVEAALSKGVARKNDDGTIVIDLTKEEIASGEDVAKVLLRADGTTVYITQDLALLEQRGKDHAPDQFIWVLGKDHDLQFRILFKIFNKLGLAKPDALATISYGMVNLPEGKMKSREGTVVDADTLLDELHALAATEITDRDNTLSQDKVTKRAEIIALAAIKFYLLQVRPQSEVKFDPKKSVAFVGKTGPYLLYTYARLASLKRKAAAQNLKPSTEVSMRTIDTPMWRVTLIIARFAGVVKKSADKHDPSILTDYAYLLAQAVNDFYEASPVLQEKDVALATIRLALATKAAQTLKETCRLLGIETLEEM